MNKWNRINVNRRNIINRSRRRGINLKKWNTINLNRQNIINLNRRNRINLNRQDVINLNRCNSINLCRRIRANRNKGSINQSRRSRTNWNKGSINRSRRTGGACFHASLSTRLRRFGFRTSTADPDLWLHKTNYGYNYITRYADDVICFSRNPKCIMDYLSKYYTMKGVGYPQFYLGGDILEMPNSWKVKYAMSAKTYITNCVKNLEHMCGTHFAPYSTPFYEHRNKQTSKVQ